MVMPYNASEMLSLLVVCFFGVDVVMLVFLWLMFVFKFVIIIRIFSVPLKNLESCCVETSKYNMK